MSFSNSICSLISSCFCVGCTFFCFGGFVAHPGSSITQVSNESLITAVGVGIFSLVFFDSGSIDVSPTILHSDPHLVLELYVQVHF